MEQRLLDVEEKVHKIELEIVERRGSTEERWKTTFNQFENISTTLTALDKTVESIQTDIQKSSGKLILFLGGVVVTLLMKVLEVF
jgi:tetrahydromethanopterin S-methyltransferase subunit G